METALSYNEGLVKFQLEKIQDLTTQAGEIVAQMAELEKQRLLTAGAIAEAKRQLQLLENDQNRLKMQQP